MPRRRQRQRQRRAAGFSVLELLLVLALMGLVLAASLRGRAPVPAGIQARAAAREVAAALRQARGEAIAANRPVAVLFDLAAGGFRVGAGPPRSLPPGVALTLLTARGEAAGAAAGRIRFDGDGGSSGGRVGVGAGGEGSRVWVGVDWLTGRVTLAEGP